MSICDENLICGAGPIGMSCALFLHERDIPCRIIEKEVEISPLSRAILINPATLTLFEESGLASKLIEKGYKIAGLNMYRNGSQIFHKSFKKLPSKYNYGLALPQNNTEEILEKELAVRGIDVERGCSFHSFRKQGKHIISTIDSDGKKEEIRSKKLIGADGINSKVRESAEIPFKGKRMKSHIFLFEVAVKSDLPLNELHLFFHGRYISMFIPITRGIFRLVTTLPHIDADSYKGMKIQEVLWDGSFRITSKLASKFRQSNLFLMGDAAHVHSPFGGKGMNNGIQDAYVFAKCLKEGGLDKYSKQRRRVASQILRETNFSTILMMQKDRVSTLIREYLIPNVLRIPGVADKMIAANMGLN